MVTDATEKAQWRSQLLQETENGPVDCDTCLDGMWLLPQALTSSLSLEVA